MKSLKNALINALNEGYKDSHQKSIMQMLMDDLENDYTEFQKDLKEIGENLISATKNPKLMWVLYDKTADPNDSVNQSEVNELISMYGWVFVGISELSKQSQADYNDVLTLTNIVDPSTIKFIQNFDHKFKASIQSVLRHIPEASRNTVLKDVMNGRTKEIENLASVISGGINDFSRKLFKMPWDIIY